VGRLRRDKMPSQGVEGSKTNEAGGNESDETKPCFAGIIVMLSSVPVLISLSLLMG